MPRGNALLLAAMVMMAFGAANPAYIALAQQQPANLPPVEGSKSGVIPPCPTLAEQSAAVGAKTADGAPAGDARPVESNVILPSAGGTRSAAPTAQQQGEALRSGIDCPMALNHPNAIKPSVAPKQGLPDFAK